MSKKFSVAGVSRFGGIFKVRFANDLMRVKHLAKVGHNDIDLVELKYPMTKEEAIVTLLNANFDNGNKEIRAALEAAQEKRAPKAPKVKKVEIDVEAEVETVPEDITEDQPF